MKKEKINDVETKNIEDQKELESVDTISAEENINKQTKTVSGSKRKSIKKDKNLTPYEKFRKFAGKSLGVVKNVAKYAALGGLIIAPIAAAAAGLAMLVKGESTNLTAPVLHVAFGIGSAIINAIAVKTYNDVSHDYNGYEDEFGG